METPVADPPADEQAQAPDVDEPDQDDDDDDDDDTSDEGQTQSIARKEETFGTIMLGGVRVKATYTGIELPEKISLKGFVGVWQAVDNIRDRSKWWQGDLLNLGADRWSEKYTQALEATGSAYQSVLNVASICRKYTVDQRHADVSFTHHASVAPAPPELREQWLTEAAENGWTVEQIRNEYREWKAEQDATKNGEQTGKSDLIPVRNDGVGIQPVDESELPEDDPGWECPTTVCEGKVFAVAVAHCMDCGAHHALQDEEGKDVAFCPYCEGKPAENATKDDDDLGEGEQDDAAVSGLVIAPDAPKSVSPDDVLAVASITDFAVDDAVSMYGITKDALPKLMALHHWIGLVIDGLAGEDDRVKTIPGKPAESKITPVPKPVKPKRAAKGSAPVAVADPDEGTDEGLPFD